MTTKWTVTLWVCHTHCTWITCSSCGQNSSARKNIFLVRILVVVLRSHRTNSSKKPVSYDECRLLLPGSSRHSTANFSSHLSHPSTFLCALAASLRATLTMLHRMLSAFLGACFTDICAKPTDRLGELAPACHKTGRHPADLRAVHVQFYAAGHCLDILFFQA